MIPTYTIWLDGNPYCGEARDVMTSKPTAGMGWSGKQPENRNAIFVGKAGNDEPLEIKGRTNLRSHMTRILDRLGNEIEASEITLRLSTVPVNITSSSHRRHE